MYILYGVIIIVLVFSFFSFQFYTSSSDKKTENTITEFFQTFYKVSPDTILLLIPNNNGINGESQNIVNYDKYVESTYKGLITKDFYEKFLVGDRYLMMVPQIASDNNFTISLSNLELTEIESSDKDKYYDFTVKIMLKDNVSGTEDILVNKGQVRVKQDYFKYKIHAIKFFDDKLVKYLK
jgi:hypothetical protein